MGASSSGSDAGGLGGSLRGIGAWGLCNGGILGTMRDTIAGLIYSLLSEGNEATLAAGKHSRSETQVREDWGGVGNGGWVGVNGEWVAWREGR